MADNAKPDAVEIKEIKTAIEETASELKSALESQQDIITKNGKSTTEASERIQKAEQALEKVSKAAEGVEGRLTKLETMANRTGVGMGQAKSLGAQFIESEIFKSVSGNGRGNDVPFFETKNITNDPASAGAATQAYQVPQYFADPNRPVYIRSLVNRTPVMTDAVKVVREDVFTNSAAPQAGQLVDKAQSNITFSEETYAVETLAHWLPASRQILADAPRMQSFIDGRLIYGLDLLMDAQLLFGDGLGNNFKGIMVDAAVGDAEASAALSTTEWLDHIRTAIATCQASEYYNINGIVLNPADWATIETAKGSDGHYVWASVAVGGEMRLWRVPVVVSNAMTAGSFVVGDWKLGATLYDREQRSVRVSESHADMFIKNGVAILAEERAAFAIELPKAFTKGTLTPAA